MTTTLVASAAMALDLNGNPGILHTENAVVQQERYQLGVSLHNKFIWDDAIWQNQELLDGKSYEGVSYSFLTEHNLGTALSLPLGFRISSQLPIYFEDLQYGSEGHDQWSLGDLRFRATWQSPKINKVPWLGALVSVGTAFPTSELGRGYYPRELEYGTAELGCHLYGCGSRNTGLDLSFANYDFRSGLTVDLEKSAAQIPWQISANISNRKTALFDSKVGPYTIKDEYFYDIYSWSLASAYRSPWYGLGVFGEYLHEARWENDWARGADRHDLSLGISYDKKDCPMQAYAGMTFGIANDAYANATYATTKGRDAHAYGFKTPDQSFFLGISHGFDLAVDRDRDGVRDYADQCKGTPANVKVDAFGCPIDSDKDMIADFEDQCAETPAGVKVDNKGCPTDSDGDRVADYLDQCAGTAAGRKVDASGCEIDTDRDGIVDALDQCAETVAGAKVDARGCEIDADADGVVDRLDQCPSSKVGVKVDANGCEIILDADMDGVLDAVDQCPKSLRGQKVDSVGCVAKDRDLSALQQGIQFEKGSDKLTKASLDVLNKVAAVLKDVPDLKIEVQGHTSRENPANDATNTILSQKRAEVVVKFLTNKGIAAERLAAKGYGPTMPIADNTTEEGRMKNRRVELVPVQGGVK